MADERIENPMATDLHSLLLSRLSMAKKFSKKAHKAWKTWINEYEIKNFADTDEVRDKVRIGYVFRKIEQDQPSMFDDQPQLFIKGRNKKAREMEDGVNAVYDLLWDIQDLETKIEDTGLYFSLLGMGFIESPWVTETRKTKEPVVDEMGQPVLDEKGKQVMNEYEVPIINQPMAQTIDPFKIYFSPETVFNTKMDYNHCPYYFVKRVWSKEKIKALFNKDIEPTEVLKVDEVDVDTTDEKINDSEYVRDDIKRVTCYEYYGCIPEHLARKVKKAQEPWRYDKEYHAYITNDETLLIEECKYRQKPLFIIGHYGLANKFWKFGDAKHLMPLIEEYETYRSQILTHTRKMSNPKPLIETNSHVDEKAFNDPRVGRAVTYSGVKPEYLSPAPLGREVTTGIEIVKSDLEKQSASFDLAGGGTNSTVKTPRGIQVYSEANDKQIARKKKKIARLVRNLMLFQFSLVSDNWSADDNIMVDVGDEEVQIDADMLEMLNYMSINNKIDIEVESLSVNRITQKQDALNLWDSAQAHPEIFNLEEVAKDLLENGYQKKDGDRYLLTPEQRQQLSEGKKEEPRIHVSIDAQSPVGLQILQNMGIISPEQAQSSAQVATMDSLVKNEPVLKTQQEMLGNEITQPQPEQTF